MGLFNPNEFDDSTGLFPNDEDAEVVGAAVVRYDYNGKRVPAVPAIELSLMGGDLEKPVKQYFGVGKAEDWAPSPEGKALIAVGKRQQLHASTNAAMLFKSMYEAGVPADLLDAASVDITKLVGLRAHWVRAKIRREGLKDDAGKEKEGFEVLLVTAIVALPGEAGTVGAGSPVAAKAQAAVLKFVAAAGKKGVKKADIPALVLGDAELAADPDCNAVLTLLVKDDTFLAAGPWSFAGGVLKAA